MFTKCKYAEQNLLFMTGELELSFVFTQSGIAKWLQNGQKIKFIF